MVIFRLKNVFEYTAYNHKIGKYSQCFHNRLFKNPFTISKVPFFLVDKSRKFRQI
jgi:hypothetical protein